MTKSGKLKLSPSQTITRTHTHTPTTKKRENTNTINTPEEHIEDTVEGAPSSVCLFEDPVLIGAEFTAGSDSVFAGVAEPWLGGVL